jgi:hypothetical protein
LSPGYRTNYNLKMANIPFENMANLKYLIRTATNKNDIHKEVKNVLNLGNACCHSDQ